MRSGLRALAMVLVLIAAACGDDDKDATPTTTASTSTSTTAAAPSTSTSTTSTTTTAPPASSTTTPTTVAPATVVIESFTGPRAPVDCDAPTMAEVTWKTRGATTVELFVGQERLGQYPNGAGSEIVPLKCDGSPRVYTLRATKGAETAVRSLTLTTNPT